MSSAVASAPLPGEKGKRPPIAVRQKGSTSVRQTALSCCRAPVRPMSVVRLPTPSSICLTGSGRRAAAEASWGAPAPPMRAKASPGFGDAAASASRVWSAASAEAASSSAGGAPFTLSMSGRNWAKRASTGAPGTSAGAGAAAEPDRTSLASLSKFRLAPRAALSARRRARGALPFRPRRFRRHRQRGFPHHRLDEELQRRTGAGQRLCRIRPPG